MKKMRLVLVMVLAMALAVPMAAFAAADLTVTGDTRIRMAYAQEDVGDNDYALLGSWRTRANLDLRAGKGNISAYARYRLRRQGFMSIDGFDATKQTFDDLQDAYLEAKGAWLPGTPEVTTRIGRWDVTNIDETIAYFERLQGGIQVSGITLGPATLGLFNGWSAARTSHTAIYGKAQVDMVELSGTFVANNNRPGDEKSSDYLFGVNLTPANGIKLSGDFARQGATEANAWKVNGELATVPNVTVRAGTWFTDPDFRPTYRRKLKQEHLLLGAVREWTDGDTRAGTTWGDPWMEKGFSIGASTTQAGLPIDVDYKSGKVFSANVPDKKGDGANDAFAGLDMSVISVGTTLAEIDTTVTFTSIDGFKTVTDIAASRKLSGLPVGGDVTLKANARLRDGQPKTYFGADAIWNAPNGLVLGLHYANYDRLNDWNHNYDDADVSDGIDIGKSGDADGFAVSFGYGLSF